ncbi:hypothetical protein M3Y94_00263100 [Aphelenchoides besseyi]|nr:hypothetical protein M3Y94_00263100 [Aphelenchoides besseyi]KAI6236155.1 hypothetical protein M3Y95_00127600 [Aphelenchoides besseyi]
MTDCDHRELFTTGIYRASVTEGCFRPHSGDSIHVSQYENLPFDQENWFGFKATQSDLSTGSFEVQFEIIDPHVDLEYAVWTEDAKGNVLNGKKDHFSANYEVVLPGNLSTAFACARVRTVTCQVCAAIYGDPYDMQSMGGYADEEFNASSPYFGRQQPLIKTEENVWDDHCDEPSFDEYSEW